MGRSRKRETEEREREGREGCSEVREDISIMKY